MRNLIVILFVIFSSCSSLNNEKQLIGTWSCEYGMEINLNQNEVIDSSSMLDSLLISEEPTLIEEEIMDTSYFPAILIFNFMNNNKIDFQYYIQHKGNWEEKNDSVFVSIDSSHLAPDGLNYKGIINKNYLYLETIKGNSKLIYCFKKQDKASAKKYNQSELIGTYWSYKESDSTLTSYHLIDSNELIINDWYGMHIGKWGYKYLNGVGGLYVTSMHTLKSSLYYMLDESENVEKISQAFGYEMPELKVGQLVQNNLLSIEKYNEISSNLHGSWISTSFKTESINCDDSVKYKDLFLKLEFEQNAFHLTYSGINTESNEESITKIKGNWHLSETGDYVILNHRKKGRDNYEYEIREIASLTSIYTDSLIIGLEYISLPERECTIRDKSIKFNKGNGL